jgi:hypothetical protein
MLQFIPNQDYIEIVAADTNTCIGEIYFSPELDWWAYYLYDVVNEQHFQQVMAYMETLP